jgi:GNAT superfamily N-acetyltransferase
MTEPRGFACSDTLRNGLTVTIRELRADDRERMATAIRKLDPESIYTRFFGHRELTEAGLDRIMRVDPMGDIALVVTVGSGADEIVIASGRCVASGAGGGEHTAEVAFVVEEDYHGLGIASRLLRHLAQIARERGMSALEADVLAGNKPMLAVFARSGLPMQKRHEGSTVHVTLSLRSLDG